MPQFENLNTKVFVAEGDITQWAVVCSGTAGGQAKLPAAKGAPGVGIAIHDAEAGMPVEVAMPGSYVRAIAAGAISRDDWLRAAGTDGRVEANTTAPEDMHLIGQAVNDAPAAGHIVFLRVDPNPPTTTA